MTKTDTYLVRILRGTVGDLAADTGSIIAVTPDVANELVAAGDAVRVQDDVHTPGGVARACQPGDLETAPVTSSQKVVFKRFKPDRRNGEDRRQGRGPLDGGSGL